MQQAISIITNNNGEVKCVSCGESNPYAIPNQNNGDFICYRCKNGY